ncbi:MAG: DUF5676 family membrane protein [Candidatus Paceibacterota bacterium]|jgi:hypothetical protein
MINTNHLFKVTVAWTSIVYTVCFLGVMMFSGIRPGFMMYALHMNTSPFQNVLTFGTFISGLIIWNIIAVLAVEMFAWLWNTIKK